MSDRDPRSDKALIEAADRGDPEAFEVLYGRYRDWVVRLAYRFTGSQDDALDVLQDTFTYLLSKFPGFRLTARMTTFLYPVVKHLGLARKRSRARFLSQAELPDRPAPEVGDAEASRQELAAVVEVLPELQREVLLMRFVDEMKLGEIARALSVPLGTVKSRLHKALQKLREDKGTREYFER